MKLLYVAQLPKCKQQLIKQALIKVGISGEDLQNAMDSKISDLIDIIDIYKLLGVV